MPAPARPRAAAAGAWHPKALEQMEGPDWEQLYVNAEHDGTVGVVTISRESYSWDVDRELNRALDWLRAQGIRRVIVTGDFHLSTQMVGADTSDFFSSLDRVEDGLAITELATHLSRFSIHFRRGFLVHPIHLHQRAGGLIRPGAL